MARAELMFPSKFLDDLEGIENNLKPVTEKALKAGGDAVLGVMQKRLTSVVGKGTKFDSKSTGELARSLGVSPMKVNRDGDHDVKVGLSEPRSNGGANAKLANILEYGKHNQKPRPFLKPTKSAAKKSCISVMQAVFEEELGK